MQVSDRSEIRRRRSTDVLLIPGIGGHPAFHQDLVDGLRRNHRVHTAAHLDFNATPCLDWHRHVRYWAERLLIASWSATGPIALIGISFGAHIAYALYRDRPDVSLHSSTLVSYRHLTDRERRLLGALPRAWRVSGYLIGTTLMRISDHQAASSSYLRSLRRALYDDERLVGPRLAARLVALASAPRPRLTGTDVTFVFGSAERVLRRRHRAHGGTAVIVPGGHAISTRPSPDLLRAIERAVSRDNSHSGRGEHQ